MAEEFGKLKTFVNNGVSQRVEVLSYLFRKIYGPLMNIIASSCAKISCPATPDAV